MILKGGAKNMKNFKSLNQFRDLVDTGYEIQFTLNGRRWLIEPDSEAPDFSDKRELIANDLLSSVSNRKFKDTDDFLNYKIDGKSVKEQWNKITDINY